MPNRMLREGILTSERVNRLGPQAEILYRRLMSVVDDFGRYHGHPGLIRAGCYPLKLDQVREADITRWLAEVQSAGLILLYSTSGKQFVQLLDTRWQVRAHGSKFPEPPPESANICAQMLTDAPVVVVVDENVDVGVVESCGEVPKRDSPPPVLVFPCSGDGPVEWPLLQEKVDEYQVTYPGINVLAECRKARQWCIEAKSQRKTFRGMPKFLNGWLSRAQDRSGSNGNRTGINRNGPGQTFDPSHKPKGGIIGTL